MVDAICRAAVSMSDETFEAMTWAGFVSDIEEVSKPELVAYLKEHRLYESQIQESTRLMEGDN